VRKHDLPEKLLVVHQFTEAMIRNEDRIRTPGGVAVTLDSDGSGRRRKSARATPTSCRAAGASTPVSSCSSTRTLA
jgi:hypothetical protein